MRENWSRDTLGMYQTLTQLTVRNKSTRLAYYFRNEVKYRILARTLLIMCCCIFCRCCCEDFCDEYCDWFDCDVYDLDDFSWLRSTFHHHISIEFNFSARKNKAQSTCCLVFHEYATEQMLRDWREDYTICLTSHFSRINESLVSQRNEYCVMCLIGCFELSAWILMIIGMSDIINGPNLHFNTSHIEWDTDSCPKFSKSYLDTAYDQSTVLLPLSATLMCLGFFWCCYLCKPQAPYGITCGVLMRYHCT